MSAIRGAGSDGAPLPIKAAVGLVFCFAALDAIAQVGQNSRLFSPKENGSIHGLTYRVSYWVGVPTTVLLLYGPFKVVCFLVKKLT